MPRLDPLTGLRDGHDFERRLEGLLERADDGGRVLSLLIADLGDLKSINQTYGREAGDLALRAAAARISATLPEPALSFRLGGDAFVVVLMGAGTTEAVAKAEMLRQTISTTQIKSQGRTIALTASTGYATYPTEAGTPRALIRLADRRLRASRVTHATREARLTK